MDIIGRLKVSMSRGSDSFGESDFFQNPLSSSNSFKRNTIETLLATCLGIFVVVQWWSVLTDILLFSIICAIFITAGTWFRTVLDHRKIRMSQLSWPTDEASAKIWKLAAQEAHAGLYSTNSIALFSFIALAMLLSHYEKPSWQRQLKERIAESISIQPGRVGDPFSTKREGVPHLLDGRPAEIFPLAVDARHVFDPEAKR
jgi:hypothetical protein